ncbi:MAG: ester cyclase [Polyangiaceae bacterium]
MSRLRTLASLAPIALVALLGCASTSAPSSTDTTAEKLWQDEQQHVAQNLALFDDLDFNVFTHQRWDDLHKSHSKDVIVHWPDGHTTNGIDKHIEDLKGMFVWAPDTRIETHPIKVGQKDWTGVVGVIEGTFTQPMPIGDGKSIPPTGKAYKVTMATFSHWTKDGPMDEEYLFWDSAELMKQLGLGK